MRASAFRTMQSAYSASSSKPVAVGKEALLPSQEGFLLLGKQALRKNHYEIIYSNLNIKACPFCGLEPFDAVSLASEDEDHYLLRRDYPLAAANLANLVPMGGKCNQRYTK